MDGPLWCIECGSCFAVLKGCKVSPFRVRFGISVIAAFFCLGVASLENDWSLSCCHELDYVVDDGLI